MYAPCRNARVACLACVLLYFFALRLGGAVGVVQIQRCAVRFLRSRTPCTLPAEMLARLVLLASCSIFCASVGLRSWCGTILRQRCGNLRSFTRSKLPQVIRARLVLLASCSIFCASVLVAQLVRCNALSDLRFPLLVYAYVHSRRGNRALRVLLYFCSLIVGRNSLSIR